MRKVAVITDTSCLIALAKANALDLLRKYIASRPKNADLSDEEIMEEVRTVRYSK
jgi:hypothetical protein